MAKNKRKKLKKEKPISVSPVEKKKPKKGNKSDRALHVASKQYKKE